MTQRACIARSLRHDLMGDVEVLATRLGLGHPAADKTREDREGRLQHAVEPPLADRPLRFGPGDHARAGQLVLQRAAARALEAEHRQIGDFGQRLCPFVGHIGLADIRAVDVRRDQQDPQTGTRLGGREGGDCIHGRTSYG